MAIAYTQSKLPHSGRADRDAELKTNVEWSAAEVFWVRNDLNIKV